MFGRGFVRIRSRIVRGLCQREQAGLLGGVVDELPQVSRVYAAADDLEDFSLADDSFAAIARQQDADGFGGALLGFAECLGSAHARQLLCRHDNVDGSFTERRQCFRARLGTVDRIAIVEARAELVQGCLLAMQQQNLRFVLVQRHQCPP